MLAAPLLLAGCVSLGPAPFALVPVTQTSASQGTIVPIRFDRGGMEALGTGQRIDFGRDSLGVIETMTRLQGAPPAELPCAATANRAYAWRDGLVLIFHNESFAGWSTPDLTKSATGATSFGQSCTPLT